MNFKFQISKNGSLNSSFKIRYNLFFGLWAMAFGFASVFVYDYDVTGRWDIGSR